MRVAAARGATPIQIDSMVLLLVERLGRLDDDGALRDSNHRARANFHATRVRFYFACAPLEQARRSLHLPAMALPVPLLAASATHDALVIMTSIRAVDVAVIAPPTQVEHLTASIDGACNPAKIVHSRARPPGIRPPRATRATTLMSDASTRGDQGSKLAASGPTYWWLLRDCPAPLPPGPTLRPASRPCSSTSE
jgi:hypothetical protein